MEHTPEKKSSPKKVLGVFTLAMINVSLICSLRGLPMMSVYGYSIIFFLFISVVMFLIPTALVSAELASTWPKRGGIYLWVKEAFGERWGFVTICLQWLQNIVFYPTALAATAAVIAYLINPALAENPVYTLCIIIGVYWFANILNMRGMKTSGMISAVGSVCGIILPGAALLILAFVWILSGQPSAIDTSQKTIIPNVTSISTIVFLTGMFLYFAGIEVSGVHALEVKDPQKDYPKAIFIAAVIVTAIFLFGSLSVAVIVPANEISLTAGVMQTFSAVLDKFNLGWLLPILVILTAPGMIVQVSSWIAGPSRGLLVTAKNGDLPPFFQKMNKNHMPVNIMIFQGIVVSLLSFVFLFMPSVSSSFWILTALAAIVYLVVYIIMFLTGIKLRHKYPHVHRPYSVPGGIVGMYIFGIIGIIACVAAIILGFIPPSQLPTGNLFFYEAFLGIGSVGILIFPFLIYALRKPHWKKEVEME
jgi:putative glutamate/gamma-aminobutyrate antiporter